MNHVTKNIKKNKNIKEHKKEFILGGKILVAREKIFFELFFEYIFGEFFDIFRY